MADLKISQLPALAGSDLLAADQLAVADTSASETKRITVTDLVGNAVTLIADATIPGAKILFSAGGVAGTAIADGGVTTAKLAADSVTAAKLADESTVDLVTTLPAAGAFTGQIALDIDDSKIYIWSGSAWVSVKGAGSVNVVNGSTTGVVNITSTTSGDTCTIAATLDDTSAAAQFLGGPTGAGGTVGYRTIIGTDLPTPTTSAKGGVIVNGNGLAMSGDTLTIDNTVTAEASENHIVQYDANGLVTGGRVIAAADVPVATSSTVGVIKPGSGLGVDAAGQVSHNNSITAGTAAKVSFDTEGHITATEALAASDIPNLDASKITTGTLPEARIGSDAVTAAKLADRSTATIAETTPAGGAFIGQCHLNSITGDYFLWDGNVWQPIGISVGEIVLAGTYNASTNKVATVTSEGTALSFVVGSALPAPSSANKGYYVVVSTAGTGTSPAPTVALNPPDFLLSTGTAYTEIDVSATVTAQQASNVAFTAAGNISATNVQAAIEELDTEKVAAANPTLTGTVALGEDAVMTFEGATSNDFETTLTVVDPTADRTVSLPNVTGTLISTGDTGTVTSAMIANGAIVNADISASAEIAVSKLANGTARQLLQTDTAGSGVEFTSNIDVPGTLDVTGAATLDSTLGVAGLISADGKVSFPLGSAAAPSLLPGADTNTGIFSPGADQLAITTAGTERLRIDSSGRTGIGATSPGSYYANQLVVDTGSTAQSGITIASESDKQGMFAFADGTSGNARFSGYVNYDHSINALTLGTTGSERMRIDSSGNVGIGTTTPGAKLGVSGSITATGSIDCSDAIASDRSASTSNAFVAKLNGSVKATITNGGNGTFGTFDTSSATAAGVKAFGASGQLVVQKPASSSGNAFEVWGGTTRTLHIDEDGTLTTAGDASINGLDIGRGAGNSAFNTAVGDNVLQSTTSGIVNTGLGGNALLSLTEGNRNTGLGYNALRSCTTATNNTAVGVDALYAVTTGATQGNTAVGDQSGRYLTTGAKNVAVGYLALFSSTTSSDNTALGASALYSNTTGTNNTATGKDALYASTTGASNGAFGYHALKNNTTGSNNSAFGTNALHSNTAGTGNVAVGRDALYNNTTPGQNTAMGFQSMLSNTTGANNTATGHQALYSNTTGTENTAAGRSALYSNTTAAYNSAFGKDALYANTTGHSNTAVGRYALRENTTGNYNTATGFESLRTITTGIENTAVGTFALKLTTGNSNTGVGYQCLATNSTATNNAGVGTYCLYLNTTGSNNAALGYGALERNTTGSNSAAVGYRTLYSNTTGHSNTAVGFESLRNSTTANNNVAVGYESLYSNTTGANNTATGYRSLYANTSGDSNVAVGLQALRDNTTGTQNSAVGMSALEANTTGHSNTAVGKNSLRSNTGGIENAAFGIQSMRSNTTGVENAAFGYNSLRNNTTANYNTGLGAGALYTNTTGANNTATGYRALYANTTGGGNVSVGFESLRNNTTGYNNVATGHEALYSNTTGYFNTAIGKDALRANTTGLNNSAVGWSALQANTDGDSNAALGKSALKDNTSGIQNTATGVEALRYNVTGQHNTANGFQALYTNTGNYNVAVGHRAMYLNTSGEENTAIGRSALYSNTTGQYNVASGYQTLHDNTTGVNNTAVGRRAMFSNTTGTDNSAFGYEALRNTTTGNSNCAFGQNALKANTTGPSNSAFGQAALFTNTTGVNNTATGALALFRNTTGGSNSAFGYDALSYNTTGIYNIALGRDALSDNTTGSGNIGIGFRTSAGGYSPVFNPSTQSNRLVLGHTSITNAYVKVSWTVTSDERDKMNFAPVPYGLDFVNKLKPTAYQFKVDRGTDTPTGDVRYGFKAQDILALEGDNPVIIDNEDADHLKYKGEHLVPVLVNAVQELTTMVNELKAELAALKGA